METYFKDCISKDWNIADKAQEKIADMMREKLFEEIANDSKIEVLEDRDKILMQSQLCVESSVDISIKCIQDERPDVVKRCFDILKSSLTNKLNNLQPKPKYLTNIRILPDWQFRMNSQDRIGWFGWIEGIY